MPGNYRTLAVDGGAPVRSAPFPPWPFFDPELIDAAVRVLSSGKVNYWTGEECRAFESEWAANCGSRYAIAMANGTVALEAALFALGIGPGDDVIVPARTYIASASCAVMRGARPVIADVDLESQLVTAETIRSVLTPSAKAIVVVHLAGWVGDMDEIIALAREYGLKVIEDCAQSHGARYKNRAAGSMGDVGCYSFCQDKIITTGGEGGMLITDDEEFYLKAWSYKDHGKSLAKVKSKDEQNGFSWLHDSFGTNLRMTEMQAAMGRVALLRLARWVEQRRSLASQLAERFSGMESLRLTLPGPDVFHSYYRFYTFLRAERLKPGWSRDRVVQCIRAEGVPCGVGSCGEIYLEKAFVERFGCSARLPAAKLLGETSLCFLVHPTMGSAEIDDAAAAVEKVLSYACA